MKPTEGRPRLNLKSLRSVVIPFHNGALADVPSTWQLHLRIKNERQNMIKQT
jgi:hypothetical protein